MVKMLLSPAMHRWSSVSPYTLAFDAFRIKHQVPCIDGTHALAVPSTRRAAVLEEYPAVDDMLSSDLSKDDDGWVATRASGYAGRNPASQQDAEIPDISSPGLHHRGARAKPMEDDIPDMDDLALHDVDDVGVLRAF